MKKILSLALALAVSLVTLGGCGGKAPTGGVTRGEWIAMLAQGFGLEDSKNTTPYYTDVDEKDELFPAVQSLGDWGILAPFGAEKLGPDKPVTRQEVAATAAIAAGFRPGESLDLERAVEFAADKGILRQDGQTELTADELGTVLAEAKEVYLNDPGEERMEVEFSPNLVDLRMLAPSGVFMEAGPGQCYLATATVTTREDGQAMVVLPWSGEQIALGPGDTFIAPPTAEFPAGIAHKITAVHPGGNHVTLDVEQPALSDLYEKLDVRTTLHADLNNIIWAQGVSATGAEGEYTLCLLGNTQDSEPFFEKEFTFQQGKHERDWTKSNSYAGSGADASAFYDSNFVYTDTPSLEDFNDKTAPWEKKLLTENKFSAGYKITGKLTIQNISATPDVQFFVPLIPESASIALNADMSAHLTLEGTLNERLKIASVPLVGPKGLSVNVDIYLYVDAYGAIQAGAELLYNTKVEWAALAGLRKEQSSSMKTSLEIEADIGFGGDVAAVIYALGVNIFDAGAKVGGEITAQAKVVGSCEETVADGLTTLLYKESMKVDATLYAPIVTLYAGSEDCLVGEGGSWELLTKENTWSLPLLDKEWVFWRKALHFDEEGNAVEVGPVAGDFSEYAGTYRADEEQTMYVGEDYSQFAQYPDIILREDGSLYGAPYSNKAPFRVEEGYLGDYRCEQTEGWADYDEYGDYIIGADGAHYYIFPVGIPSSFTNTEDTTKVRLTIIGASTGVDFVNYTKID